MCGIVGYVGPKQATDVLLAGLASLEYRGYDSAGVAIVDDDGVDVLRRVGKLANLREAVEADAASRGTVGIGHTRWATHGRPTEENAHPHTDCTGAIARRAQRHHRELPRAARGARRPRATPSARRPTPRRSRTSSRSTTTGDLAEAVRDGDGAARRQLRARRRPRATTRDTIVAARQDSPLIIGVGDGENIVASDIPAVLRHTREVLVLEDGDVATVDAGRASTVVDQRRRPATSGAAAHRLGPRGRREGRLRGLHAQGDPRAAEGASPRRCAGAWAPTAASSSPSST